MCRIVLGWVMLWGLLAYCAADAGEAVRTNHVAPERTKGWSWTPRKDAVQPDCGKRNPVFYEGEPVTFSLGPAAANYEVRDYWGERVDQGPAAQRITLKVQKPGWYKLYVYGKEATRQWRANRLLSVLGTGGQAASPSKPLLAPLTGERKCAIAAMRKTRVTPSPQRLSGPARSRFLQGHGRCGSRFTNRTFPRTPARFSGSRPAWAPRRI